MGNENSILNFLRSQLVPKDEPSHLVGTHRYKGLTFSNIIVDSSIDAMETFESRDGDVWIVTFPRSGTHWLMEIVGLIYADGDPDNIDRSLVRGTVCMLDMHRLKWPKSRREEIAAPPDAVPFLERIESAKSPRTIASHLPLNLLPPDLATRSKVIYVARNPKDVVCSLFTLISKRPNNIPPWDQFLEIFMDGSEVSFGPWVDHVVPFWKLRNESNVLFLFYEDMQQDLKKVISKVAEHIGRPLSEEILQQVLEHSTFEGMKKTYEKSTQKETNQGPGNKEAQKETLDVSHVNKGKTGQWKEHFTVAQSEAFDKWFQDKMSGSDLEFKFV